MEEENKLTPEAKAFLGAVLIGSVGFAYSYGVPKLKKWKRNKKLREYLTRLGYLEASKRRLIRTFSDPSKSEDDFLDALAEEEKFLRIITEPSES